MRRILVCLLGLALVVGTVGMSRPAHADEGAPIGITVGADYWNNYFWRGTDFFGSGVGVFFPWLYYSVGKTGLSLMYMGQYAAETLGDGTGKSDPVQGKGLVAYEGAHFNAAYKYTVNDTVTIGVSGWYYWFYRAEDKLGYDWSWLEGTLSLTVNALPLNPTISYTYDYFVDKSDVVTPSGEQGKNHYIKLAVGHSIKLAEGSSLGLGLSAGYFDWNSMDKKGVSDVVASAKLTAGAGGVSFNGSLNFAYVPAEDFNSDGNDKYRWWAAFGASYSF